MSNEVMFIQAGHDSKIVELSIPEKRTESALIAALVAAGLLNDENLLVFVDDAEEEMLRTARSRSKVSSTGAEFT